MRSLNGSQLAIKRELEARRHSFSNEDYVRERVEKVEKHLGELISQWEDRGPGVVAGADVECVRDMSLLQDFLGPKEQSFDRDVAEPMAEVQNWLRVRLYAEKPAKAVKNAKDSDASTGDPEKPTISQNGEQLHSADAHDRI